MQLINAFACDDIRQELFNKFSYMGVYDRIITSPIIPIKVVKLCFVQFLLIDVGEYQVKNILMGPNRKVGEVNFIDRAVIVSNSQPSVFRSAFDNIEFKDYGDYELQMSLNGRIIQELTFKFTISPRPA